MIRFFLTRGFEYGGKIVKLKDDHKYVSVNADNNFQYKILKSILKN